MSDTSSRPSSSTTRRRSAPNGEIPLIHPSIIRNHRPKSAPLIPPSPGGTLGTSSGPEDEDEEEDEEEEDAEYFTVKPGDEFRLDKPTKEEEEPDFWDEFFDSLMLTVPFSCLFFLLDMLVNKQYNRHPYASTYISHLMTAVPTLGMIVFYTNRHPTHFLTTSALMTASIFSGSRLIWLVNKASFHTTIAEAPAVGTLWILTITQLPLGRAVLALMVVGGWSWWTEMKFRP